MESDLIVKITDNSLSRDLFPGDYNCLGDNENRPVKWLAVEAIRERRFSPASDVVGSTVGENGIVKSRLHCYVTSILGDN